MNRNMKDLSKKKILWFLKFQSQRRLKVGELRLEEKKEATWLWINASQRTSPCFFFLFLIFTFPQWSSLLL